MKSYPKSTQLDFSFKLLDAAIKNGDWPTLEFEAERIMDKLFSKKLRSFEVAVARRILQQLHDEQGVVVEGMNYFINIDHKWEK